MEPFSGFGRNVTTDNFFRSVLLAKKTTETIRVNKEKLPKLAKERKDKMTWFSSKLYKLNHITLTVYSSKPTKKRDCTKFHT